MKSRTISFKLKDPRDRDLMEWLEGLGERERSFYIRKALREWLAGGAGREESCPPPREESPPPPSEGSEVEELERKLDRLDF